MQKKVYAGVLGAAGEPLPKLAALYPDLIMYTVTRRASFEFSGIPCQSGYSWNALRRGAHLNSFYIGDLSNFMKNTSPNWVLCLSYKQS